MKPPISLVLATAENCQLGCSGCPTGRVKIWNTNEKPGVGVMSLVMADRIITKAKAEAHVLSVCTYYFNEVLIYPHIVELVKLIQSHGFYQFLSTNLNTFKHVPELMALEPTNIIVSLSGWSNETYQRYHAGGDVEVVKANMVKLAALRKPGTFLRMSWHDFHYNRHEQAQAKAFADEHGYCFTPYGVGVLPLERTLARWQDGQLDPAEKDILVPLQEAKKLSWPRRHWNCQMQQQTMTVDAAGNVYNCSDRYNSTNLRGSFFERSVTDILKARKTDFDCVSCKAVGGHIYGAQEYTVPLTSVRRWLDIPFRGLKLQGLFQRLDFDEWRNQVESHYDRPQK